MFAEFSAVRRGVLGYDGTGAASDCGQAGAYPSELTRDNGYTLEGSDEWDMRE